MMKKIVGIIGLLCCSYQLQAQKIKTSQDSIHTFYDELFSVMKKDYVYKDNVNWSEIESEISQIISQYTDFQSSLIEVTSILDFAKADHSKISYKNAHFTGSFDGPTEKDFSEQWLKKYATHPGFEVKVLDNQFGYILMPAMSFDDRRRENIHKQSQPMYDAIHKVKTSQELKGWIIDLRFNTGGDSEPMLLALYDFLGNNNIWGVLDIDKKQINEVKFNNGKYISNSKKSSYINPKGALLDKTKVAIITNIATGSSGEVTALAFKGRENTIFIGEKTNGKTTANYVRVLPFGALFYLTMGFDCDRNGVFYDQIIPDVTIDKKDNFDDLMQDENIQESIKFIISEQ